MQETCVKPTRVPRSDSRGCSVRHKPASIALVNFVFPKFKFAHLTNFYPIPGCRKVLRLFKGRAVMEVVSAQEVSLANYEVLVFLQEQRHKMSKPGHYHGHKVSGSVATIMLETLTSLESPGRLERLDNREFT